MSSDFASGNVTVFVDGVEKGVISLDDSYADATITISGLNVGNHIIGIRYNGNDNYNASDIVTKNITVEKASSKVTIDQPIENVAYGNAVEVHYAVENRTELEIKVIKNQMVTKFQLH